MGLSVASVSEAPEFPTYWEAELVQMSSAMLMPVPKWSDMFRAPQKGTVLPPNSFGVLQLQ